MRLPPLQWMFLSHHVICTLQYAKLVMNNAKVREWFPVEQSVDTRYYNSSYIIILILYSYPGLSLTMQYFSSFLFVLQILEMECRDDAESFACLLDGYYRLLVDYYHYLSETIAPPSLVRLVKNRCHGPIPYVPFTTSSITWLLNHLFAYLCTWFY